MSRYATWVRIAAPIESYVWAGLIAGVACVARGSTVIGASLVSFALRAACDGSREDSAFYGQNVFGRRGTTLAMCGARFEQEAATFFSR